MKTQPFLLFDGDCSEAMAFYRECLGGELTLTKLGDTPMKTEFPADKHGRIIYSRLMRSGLDISAADRMADDFEPVRGNMSAVYVVGDSFEELKPGFEKLKDGPNNSRLQDLHVVPFGVYGQLYDRYGVQWIFRAG